MQNKVLKRFGYTIEYFLLVLLILIVWNIMAGAGKLNPVIMPSPPKIIQSAWKLISNGSLFKNALISLTRVLKGYYDHILIDCPAGIGSGFETAVAPADRAVLVANAEPLSVRSCNKVRAKLQYCSVNDISLIINRFNERKFRRMDVYEDLDAVIDEAGARLLGVVPDDGTAASASQKGLPVEGRMKASFAFDRIAARLDGKDVPLLIE